ncbi:hypothetical protein VTN77DRAFT_6728 [Rasamsonia byssochlamydoides]|uniref:uncharacterized protein n=1 Tax=Rasamsonia byssochlamydoides TaxID=89139 RepID=UPI003743D4E4
MSQNFYEGQRLSFDGALCTVRYIGEVEGTKGDWLGVEWDDPTRGKHSGEHKGVKYFKCKSKQPTAGSFVRPNRPADQPRSFLEALRQKYASEFEEELARRKQGGGENAAQLHDLILISGKVVEEVGFEKIRKQLAELQELKIVLLDGLCVAGVLADDNNDLEKREDELKRIEQTCPKIIELDLSRNLLRRWLDVRDICKQLKQLRSLKLNGNRFENVQPGLVFNGISELHIDETFLPWDEIALLTHQFPSLMSLIASTNQISLISSPLSTTIRNLTLEYNEITSLSSIQVLVSLPNIERLSLRGNNISSVVSSESTNDDHTPFQFSRSLKYLDVSHNRIDSWQFVNALPNIFPGLSSLRISDNPLYDQPVAPTNVTNLPEKPMTVDEAFMLTLARLGNLQTLNYSKISQQDRTNGELYYLSLIGKELSAYPQSEEKNILSKHPRFMELCEIYGEPTIKRATDASQSVTINPRSVAARLVKFKFYLSLSSPLTADNHAERKREQTCEIPRTFDIYRIKAIVSRLFALPPLKFRLIWETDEWDPVEEVNIGGEEWDSGSDDDDDQEEDVRVVRQEASRETGSGSGKMQASVMTKEDGSKFIKREVELADSTRQVGFWFDDNLREATVRIEAL